jgi:hypothetical protein
MSEFKPNEPVETTDAKVEVTITPDNPLRTGRHRFRLVVVDDSGNTSAPDEVDVFVMDESAPTAVLEAPKRVRFGESFPMSGARSIDAGGGTIVRYIWTLIEVT